MVVIGGEVADSSILMVEDALTLGAVQLKTCDREMRKLSKLPTQVPGRLRLHRRQN